MLEIQQIKKFYGQKGALNNISIHIPEGICFGLIGPNGAGKSTLMKILAGILESYEGDVMFMGQNMRTHSKQVKRSIGYVPQDIVLNETLSAMDNLQFSGVVQGLSSKEGKKRADEIIEFVGLTERKKDPVKDLWGKFNV